MSAPLPTGDQIRTWLHAHGWAPATPGRIGTFWTPPNGAYSVSVLHDDVDWATAGAIQRIADRVGRPSAEVRLEMLAEPGEEQR